MTELQKAEALKKLYGSHPGVKAIFDFATDKNKNVSEITADHIEKYAAHIGTDIGRYYIVDAFKKIAELELGDYIVGRRGQPTRLRWMMPMLEANQLAHGEISSSTTEITSNEKKPQMTEQPNIISHSFNLRPNFIVELKLPQDFNEKEAVRLSEFIRTLPFAD
jgi:hypothetical protein